MTCRASLFSVFALALAATGGCASDTNGGERPEPAVDGGGEAPDADPGPRCAAGAPEVVSMTTTDGVELEADLLSAGVEGGPGVVLLHMIPPSNDRRGYPNGFLIALRDAGLAVVNLDRRGAGGSGGVAREAYTGPKGKWDVLAAVQTLVDQPCAIDPARIAVVGASNGTTSLLDYAVYAAGEASAPAPAALAFLSGGAYTEAQQSMEAARPAIAATPAYFAYPTAETAWNATQAAGAPDVWEFHEYAPGAHGTGLFQSDPGIGAALVGFLTGVFEP